MFDRFKRAARAFRNPPPEAPPETMRYGDDNTYHHTGHVDVEVTKTGKVVSVWYRCATLQFRQSRANPKRAADMLEIYKAQPPNIVAIEFEVKKRADDKTA